MKIISGTAKGRYIHFPADSKARPTTDRIKGSLFDILSSVNGKRFLDAYAGSGSVGIEALSRGAAYAAFIEKDERLSGYIKKNLSACGFDVNYNIFTNEVTKVVSALLNKRERFDIVFADPPYEEGLVAETIKCFARKPLFEKDGFVVIQHSRRERINCSEMDFGHVFDERRYGDTVLSFIIFEQEE